MNLSIVLLFICRINNIVVADVDQPVISDCPADILTTNDPGNCSAVVTWTAPTADDNCAVDSFISSADPGDVFPVGTSLVEYAAADSAGNSSTCSFNVIVVDGEDPSITCPPDINANVDYATNTAVVVYTPPEGTDNCTGAVTVQTAGLPSGAAFPTGTTVNTFTVMDTAGNSAECSFNVVVNDNYPLTVKGLPAEHDTPTPYAYGTNLVRAGAIITNTVTSPADEADGTRYICSGWMGTGSVPPSGDLPEIAFAFLEPSTLTWLWDTEYLLSWSAVNGRIEGLTSGWKGPGMIFDLVPYASAGYVFAGWEVDGLAAGAAPVLSVTSDAPHSIEAFFAAAAWDLNVTGTAQRISVRYDPSRTAYLATFEVCNTNHSSWLMTDRFVYGLDSAVNMQVRGKDGVNPFGEDYLDVTAEILTRLPLIGNGDLILDPGECVVLDEIELTGKKLVDTPSRLYAKGALDLFVRDTDGDGLPNRWEDETGLDCNDPADARRDQDGDGMPAIDEYWANTDPLNPQSLLCIQNVGFVSGTHSVIWIGGTSVLQYLEWAETLPGTWMTLATNLPPTLITNLFSGEMTDTQGFYRIRTRWAE